MRIEFGEENNKGEEKRSFRLRMWMRNEEKEKRARKNEESELDMGGNIP